MIYNVLIVDDEPFIVKALARILKDTSINVIPCHTSDEARQILFKDEHICLAIIDIQLAAGNIDNSENGIKLIEHIKEHYGIPIFAISGNTEHLIRATHAGAVESIRKPYDPVATELLVNHYLKSCPNAKKHVKKD